MIHRERCHVIHSGRCHVKHRERCHVIHLAGARLGRDKGCIRLGLGRVRSYVI